MNEEPTYTPKDLEQRCDDCGELIKQHEDNKWKLNLHVIRCKPCQQKAIALGYDEWEARFVS